jgi:hypothetical protein
MPRLDPLELRFRTGLEQPYRTTVSLLPLVGWNLRDGWMPGLVVHNEVLPLRDFGWHVAPMWGLKSGTLTGFARMSHRFGPWIARAEARRFSAPAQASGYAEEVYRRAALVGEAKFHRRPTSPWSSAVRVEAVDLRSDAAPAPGEFVLPVVPPRSGRQSLGVAASATWKGRRISHSLAVNARAFTFKDYLSSPEALILTADRSAIFTAATYAGAFRYDAENHAVNADLAMNQLADPLKRIQETEDKERNSQVSKKELHHVRSKPDQRKDKQKDRKELLI